jgi:opacity protein-like surface antigen
MHFDAPENPPPQKRRRGAFREWGFNLHLEAALLGNRPERASNAGMAGVGFGFRYRPLPPLAFEAGIDLLTGTDFQGYSRSEGALLLNTLVFFNPHDVVQLYGLGGIGFSGATVRIAPRSGEAPFQRYDDHYSYFGGQLGVGLEVRVTRRVALSGDLVGFIRGRTDDLSDDVPEFTDPNTHRTTNTSGGGLIRLGASFYW